MAWKLIRSQGCRKVDAFTVNKVNSPVSDSQWGKEKDVLKAKTIQALSLGHCFFNKTSVYERSINLLCTDNFAADVVNCAGILRWRGGVPDSRVRSSCLSPLFSLCFYPSSAPPS